MKFKIDQETMAMRVAKEIPDGSVVNLGLGIPNLVCNLMTGKRDIVFQAELGIIGYNELITDVAEIDWDFYDAGAHPVRLGPGASIVDIVEAFAMIHGGHIDITVLGAFQVSEKGDLANWWRPDVSIPNVGGAMDVAVGARRVFVVMEHTSPDGDPRIVRECSLPITAAGTVNTIFTDIAVIDVTQGGLVLREVVPDWSPEQVQELTEPKLIWEQEPKIMEL